MNTANATLDREVTRILGNVVRHGVKVPWRSSVRSFGGGEHRSTHRGTGNDFDVFRPMEQGDDIRRMSARLYATTRERMVRVDRPDTKIYSYVLVDVDTSMNIGSKRVTKRLLAAELAGSCILSLNKSKDRVGTVLFSREKVEGMVTPQVANTEAAYLSILNVLTKRRTAPKPLASGKVRRGLVEALFGHVPAKRSLVFIISDFQRYTDEDWAAIKSAGAMHDVVCMHVQDPRERSLPIPQYSTYFGWIQRWFPTLYDLQDPSSGTVKRVWNTARNRDLYARNFRVFEADVHSRFKAAHCRWVVISTEEGNAAFPSLIRAFGGAR